MLSCGFDSSAGKALHWNRRARGFESRSKPENFSGLCFSSVMAAFAFIMTSNYNHVTGSMKTVLMKSGAFLAASELHALIFCLLKA